MIILELTFKFNLLTIVPLLHTLRPLYLMYTWYIWEMLHFTLMPLLILSQLVKVIRITVGYGAIIGSKHLLELLQVSRNL